MPKYPEADARWEKLWAIFYNIDNRDWTTQAPRLREIARQAQALAEVCEKLQSPKE